VLDAELVELVEAVGLDELVSLGGGEAGEELLGELVVGRLRRWERWGSKQSASGACGLGELGFCRPTCPF